MEPVPLVAVTLVFQSRSEFAELRHVVSAVSLFLDASVELSLDVACKFGSLALLDRIWNYNEVYSLNFTEENGPSWTLWDFLRTDPLYRQNQFRKAMIEAVWNNDVAIVPWLASKFPGATVEMGVVDRAASSGSLEMLQVLYDQNTEDLGLNVQWEGNFLAAGARSRSIEVMEWLHAHVPSDPAQQSTALEAAVCSGSIAIAKWMLAHGATWTRNLPTLRSAHFVAENSGSIEMLQWLDEQGQLDGLRGLVIKAAGSGFADTVRWLLDRGVKNSEEEAEFRVETRFAIHSAASNGYLSLAKYLQSRAFIPVDSESRTSQRVQDQQRLQAFAIDFGFWDTAMISSQTMLKASKKGYLDVVQWLYTEFGDDPDIDLFSRGLTDSLAMDSAASNGHLSVLQYVHEVQLAMKSKKRKRDDTQGRTIPECSIKAMDGAARNGHLPVVQWLHNNRSEGCSVEAMNGAASNGHLEVVEWLFTNRSEGCTTFAMDSAAENGHLDVVKYLHSKNIMGSKNVMNCAADSGHLELVKWLHYNNRRLDD
ncbi:putative ankyrin repeat protein [Phytophthora citrophthora]|uniref:Ankyrin repeat protein n=1 Tax=Phytophthora citrophthora TaxID=4793 RepID=A0AAD9GMV2_9STRA|nr:putative ankyrin repeat protein [Phytophthora citrophthora]